MRRLVNVRCVRDCVRLIRARVPVVKDDFASRGGRHARVEAGVAPVTAQCGRGDCARPVSGDPVSRERLVSLFRPAGTQHTDPGGRADRG